MCVCVCVLRQFKIYLWQADIRVTFAPVYVNACE